MWQQIFFGIALITGAWLLVVSIRSAAQFDAFCHRLAALRGEQDELLLASDTKDESYGPYRMKIYKELVKPSKSDFIPKELESEASELGHRMALATDFLFIYLAALALGLCTWLHSLAPVQPNPSLKRRANGVPPGPRGRSAYHQPRGPVVTPSAPA